MEFTKKDLNKTLWVKRVDQEKSRKRYRVDATGKTLGRLAVDIANKLMWKDSAYLSDFWDAWAYVLVENAGKFIVKSITLGELIVKDPTKALWFAVRWMLPKNKLRDSRMKRLKLEVATTTKYDNFKPVNLYK